MTDMIISIIFVGGLLTFVVSTVYDLCFRVKRAAEHLSGSRSQSQEPPEDFYGIIEAERHSRRPYPWRRSL